MLVSTTHHQHSCKFCNGAFLSTNAKAEHCGYCADALALIHRLDPTPRSENDVMMAKLKELGIQV
jgi:hypothetical protein